LVLYQVLQKLPGYTRATLEAEEAGLVQRWLIAMDEEAKEQAAAARRARHK